MKDAERYQKEFDLILQEMEEREMLQRQSVVDERAAFVIKMLGYKAMQDLLKHMPIEDRKTLIDDCLRRKFPDSD
jgi:hypothetical protein